MKHIQKYLTVTIFAIAAALFLYSCRGGDNGYIVDPTVADIVVLDKVTENGTYFQLSLPESEDIIDYHTAQKIPTEQIPAGDCVYIRYTTVGHQPYTSGPIELYSISPINNFKAEVAEIDKTDIFSEGPSVTVNAVWPMMSRVIMYAALPYSSSKRTIKMLVDKETLEYEAPVAYLYHDLEGTGDGFDRNYYLAFDFSALREEYKFNEIIVRVLDMKLGTTQFRIKF